ncbi:MAG TPA: hypothetical protein VKY45_10295, partial [Marinilabiliaceae bacterium]|nr:hypothetical protein [Marinilabiliaceae bacterium]
LVKAETIFENSFDMSARNLNNQTDAVHLPPQEIIDNIKKNNKMIAQLMSEVESILKEGANG